MSGNGFRGVSAEQDGRFKDKERKLMASMRFPREFETKVNLLAVNWTVMKPWIATRVTELLGIEDDVLIEYIYAQLEGKQAIDPRQLQINLTGFLEQNAASFCKELWSLLMSAESNGTGIPQRFLDEKAEEVRRQREEREAIAGRLREEREKEALEREAADRHGSGDRAGHCGRDVDNGRGRRDDRLDLREERRDARGDRRSLRDDRHDTRDERRGEWRYSSRGSLSPSRRDRRHEDREHRRRADEGRGETRRDETRRDETRRDETRRDGTGRDGTGRDARRRGDERKDDRREDRKGRDAFRGETPSPRRRRTDTSVSPERRRGERRDDRGGGKKETKERNIQRPRSPTRRRADTSASPERRREAPESPHRPRSSSPNRRHRQ